VACHDPIIPFRSRAPTTPLEMPIIQGLLRRRGQASETDLNRRHSLLFPSPSGAADTRAGRLSEQLPRRDAGASDSLELTPQSSAPAIAFSSTEKTVPEDRPVSPPVQDATPKQSRRFSMMKFRHASDSQLSTRARQQAEADAAPPMPRRMFYLLQLIDIDSD
jgi:hypothetical protein